MRVVRLRIHPIWSRRASFWAVPSALTVLPATAANALDAPAKSGLLPVTMVLMAFMTCPSREVASRLFLAPHRSSEPAPELWEFTAGLKILSCCTVAFSTILFPSRTMVASL